MGSTVTTWDLHWKFTSTCRNSSTCSQSKNKPRITSISYGLRKFIHNSYIYEQKPATSNWAEIVKNSRELVTEEIFNLAKNWLFPEAYSGDNASIAEISTIFQQAGNAGTNATPTIIPMASPTSNIIATSQARLPVCE